MGLSHAPSIVTNGLVLALDPANVKSLSTNMFSKSLDIYSFTSGAVAVSCTQTRDTTTPSPVSGIPIKMTLTGGADVSIPAYNSATWNVAPAASGETWTVSVYVKGSKNMPGEIFIFGADSTGNAFPAVTDLSKVDIAITTSWTRVSFTYTFTQATTSYIQFRLDGPNSGATAGDIIWWDGVQVEKSSAPTKFNPNYFGSAVWKDLSVSSNSAVISNGAYYSASANALVFDGINDEVKISSPVIGLPTGNSARTISIWFYTETATWADNVNNLFYYGSNGTTRNAFGIDFSIYPTMEIWTQADDLSFTVSGSSAGWHHVSITYDGNLTLTAYYNGSQVATKTLGGQLSTTNTDLNIGSFASTSFFLGKIAHLTTYSRALSAAEISQNFNALRGRFGL